MALVIKVSNAQSGGKGHYKRVAVFNIEVGDDVPTRIVRQDQRLVKLWDHVSYGGPKSQYGRALSEAVAMGALL